jgi:hypothetical protein
MVTVAAGTPVTVTVTVTCDRHATQAGSGPAVTVTGTDCRRDAQSVQ